MSRTLALFLVGIGAAIAGWWAIDHQQYGFGLYCALFARHFMDRSRHEQEKQ